MMQQGLILNEDCNHFFIVRSEKDMTQESLFAFIDQYAETQISQIVLNPNCMRTSYRSAVWENIWEHGKQNPPTDPYGINWVRNAQLLDQKGINPYVVWIQRCREKGISPWISMRMNDVHHVSDPSYFHSAFWVNHPEFRRGDRIYTGWPDLAFDYGHPEVREYHMKLIREYFELYDFDGLELDWMRFGYHFKPGFEEEGNRILTDFHREVRQLANDYSKRRGHPIQISVRVPSRPQTAKGMGLDPIPWAKAGLIDQVVIAPFWATIEFDMPVELWKELLRGTSVTLAAGLEINLRPTPKVWPKYGDGMNNSAETVFGAAASLLYRGADRIYLFNYMDSVKPEDYPDYSPILHQAGTLATATSGVRRHIVTYSDTWAPGEPQAYSLPASVMKGGSSEFRIPIGPRPQKGFAQNFIGLGEEGNLDTTALEVYVNTVRCRPSSAAIPKPIHPIAWKTAGFEIPVELLHDGYNHVRVLSTSDHPQQIVWVEIQISSES
jgi:hypothetical protein